MLSVKNVTNPLTKIRDIHRNILLILNVETSSSVIFSDTSFVFKSFNMVPPTEIEFCLNLGSFNAVRDDW